MTDTNVRVRRNALTYEFGGRSFFADVYNATMRGDHEASDRLARHQREYDIETRGDTAAQEARLAEYGAQGLELRANPNTTLGTGGEFSPPLWLVSKFASAASAGRVLGDLCDPVLLPPGVASVNIPRLTTGATVAVQPGQAGVVASVDQVTTSVTSTVVTIAGEVDASQQLFDQTPNGYDMVAYVDMTSSYAASLDAQLFAGSGTNGQLLGLSHVTVPSGHTIDGTTATTLTLLWPMIGKAYAAVGNDRKLPPTHWLMAPRRWGWIGAALDTQNRPIIPPGMGSPVSPECPMAGGTAPVGPLWGKPVYEAGAIPAGTAADTIYAIRPSDLLLFESTPKFAVDQQVLSGVLQVRMQLRRYVAFIPHRTPSSIALVNNLPQPAGF